MSVCSERSKMDLFWGLRNKKGTWCFGGNKFDDKKFYRGLNQEHRANGVERSRCRQLRGLKQEYIHVSCIWQRLPTATKSVCTKRSKTKRDLFWGLHNKKGAWYFGGTKVRQLRSSTEG